MNILEKQGQIAIVDIEECNLENTNLFETRNLSLQSLQETLLILRKEIYWTSNCP